MNINYFLILTVFSPIAILQIILKH